MSTHRPAAIPLWFNSLAFFLLLAAAVCLVATPAQTGQRTLPSDQPFASYWFPNELLAWSPEIDPDAPYNRSLTPLRDRFLGDLQVNPHARPNEARISPLSIFWATSGNPSQGSLDIDYYTCSYWPYMDNLVFWGGSAGEGLILAPNGGIIDAAHRNGVPVLGTIFFPPNAYGGNIQWVRDLVQRAGDSFPVADKLIEVAEYYGFDGYFINQETSGGNSALANDLIDFMKYFQANSDLQIMWYDAMIESGAISWQEQLNSLNDRFFQDGSQLVSERMFLDFGWNGTDLQSSRTYARSLGRSEFELHAGIDVQANGYNTGVNWGAVFPEGLPHVTSLGLYVPSWTYHSASGLTDFYDRDNRFWVGPNRDPSNTNTSEAWKGLAHYVPDLSSINDLPFGTAFGTGQGYGFALDGVPVAPPGWSGQGWNNIALQDLLPSWRWIVESPGAKLAPAFDWSDAYYGGGCLRISGALLADNHIKLYKTDLPVTPSTQARLVFKTGRIGASSMRLGVALASSPQDFLFHELGATTTTGWEERVIDLSGYQGERIAAISLFFPGGHGLGYEMKVGLLVVEDGDGQAPAPPSDVVVEKRTDEGDFVTLRLRFHPSTDPVLHYNVYRRNPDLTSTWVAGTASDACFVAEVPHVPGDSLVTMEVEAVGPDFRRSSRAIVTFPWDAPPLAAGLPDPAAGASGVVRNPILGWHPGSNAVSHDVYFGASYPPPLVASQTEVAFDPGPLEANTLYHWRIDERNQVGVTPGPPWSFTTGESSADPGFYALDFDGQNDFVDCGDGSLAITGPRITLEARILAHAWKPNVWEGSIVNKEQNGPDHGYMLRAGGSGRLSFNLGSGSWNEVISPVGSMETGRWIHVAGTYDGTTMRLFIGGEQVGSLARSFNIGDAGVDLFLGNSQSNPGRVFDGLIDEVRVWNRARPQGQIRAYMDRELPEEYFQNPDSGLVGYWRLNEGRGQQTEDLASGAHHGRRGTTTGGDGDDPLWFRVLDFPTGAGEPWGLEAPPALLLHPSEPNPFAAATSIRFDLPRAGGVRLAIFDLTGREVRALWSGPRAAGSHVVSWDGRDEAGRPLSAGLYLCRMTGQGQARAIKMLRVR